jgi:hypothetical protein
MYSPFWLYAVDDGVVRRYVVRKRKQWETPLAGCRVFGCDNYADEVAMGFSFDNLVVLKNVVNVDC